MGLLQKTTTISKPEFQVIAGLSDIDDFPIPTFQITLDMEGSPVALFQSISGLSVTRGFENISEGGVNDHTYDLPNGLSYGHVTLENGLTSPDFFLKWMLEGQYEGNINRKVSLTLIQRRTTPDGTEPYMSWQFNKPVPVSWSIGDLSVTDAESVVVESLEIAFESFIVEKL